MMGFDGAISYTEANNMPLEDVNFYLNQLKQEYDKIAKKQ